jgi:hypothetical protein
VLQHVETKSSRTENQRGGKGKENLKKRKKETMKPAKKMKDIAGDWTERARLNAANVEIIV